MLKRLILLLSVLFSLIILFLILRQNSLEGNLFALAAGKPTPQVPQVIQEVEQAVLNKLSQSKYFMPVAAIYTIRVERVMITADGAWASSWLYKVDPQTGQDVESEPGLAILNRQGNNWAVALPGEANWTKWLESAPVDLLPAGEKEQWLTLNAESQVTLPSAPLTGYLLPWEGGVKGTLTGSLTHDGYLSCNSHFAFDFIITDPATGYGKMFPIRAAKGGTVSAFWDSQATNDHSAPNYIVLKDTSTNPITYQLYLHLDQNSIPPEFKVIGANVLRGQIIGVADNTGMSTGHHLHYMVYVSPVNEWWGRSVDITFGDVDINGGRPRMRRVPGDPNWDDFLYCNNASGCAAQGGYTDVCSSYRNDYISGNVFDPSPPTGGLTAPSDEAAIGADQVTISGWAQDEVSGLKSAQVKAYYNGAWHNIGATYTSSPFSFDWNLCQAGVPDGPVTFGLSLMDRAFNPATLDGVATIIKNYNCPLPAPPPTCQPTANQVAVFAQENYQGDCKSFSAGSYDNGEIGYWIGEDTASSILVGANVRATLFAGPTMSGRSETFTQGDSNLADNSVGSRTLSSMIIQTNSTLPSMPQLIWPAASGIITQTQSLTLYWRDTGGASEFQARVIQGTQIITSTWQADSYWNLRTGVDGMVLNAGAYTWQVRARNSAGSSAWSSSPFSIVPDTLATSVVTAPFTENFETNSGGWSGTGYWHYTDIKPVANPTHSWWFGTLDGQYGNHYLFKKAGDLTSPEIIMPASGSYYLRFKYRSQTESNLRFWDQRWVQIKVGNEPFRNLYQITDDLRIPYSQPDILWLNSPVVDLSGYVGQVIRIRFNFDTIEPSFTAPYTLDNDYEGWYIDDVSITDEAPPNCSSVDEPNNSPSQAKSVAFAPADPSLAELCPAGDVDYFKFYGNAGDRVSANIDKLLPSDLDLTLSLLDTDGSSELAVNDDEKYPDINDPLLVYRLSRSGTYYLKVKAWDHPGVGSPDYVYSLRLAVDNTDPTAHMLVPTSHSYIYPGLTFRVQASDALSSVDRVEFYYHTGDWTQPAWTFLGYGTLNQGTWQYTYANQAFQQGVTIMTLVYDKAGQVTPLVAWELDYMKPNFTYWLPLVQR